MSHPPPHTKHFPSGPGVADRLLTFTSNTSPPQLPQTPPKEITCVADNQVRSSSVCVSAEREGGNVMAKAVMSRAGDSSCVTQPPTFPITAQTAPVCLKTIFSHKFSPRHSALIKVLGCFTHFGRTWEVKQAMRGAISLHHISLIHFLVEWLKLPAMRNVGQRGRLSEQRAAGKQTKQKTVAIKLPFQRFCCLFGCKNFLLWQHWSSALLNYSSFSHKCSKLSTKRP